MKKCVAFIKRNLLEMVRDPLIYIFCLGFPVVMLILFQVINAFTQGSTPMFEPAALVPGILVFSFTFVTLLVGLLVSKDRSSAFLIRLYTSPMTCADFVLGYGVPCLVLGVAQEIICIFFGWILSLIVGAAYFSFGAAMLLIVAMLPTMITCVFLGILFGSVLNDKSAPGISSVVISAAGVLGGAWMPLDVMGGFETFCRFLPFYPAVYLGRVVTGAYHTAVDPVTGVAAVYSFDGVAVWGLVAIGLYLALCVVGALLAFKANMRGKKR